MSQADLESSDGGIVIDHLTFSKRWRSSLQDVCAMRGADDGSDHHLLMAKVRLRIAKVRKGDSGRVRFEVKKLKDLKVRNASSKVMWRPTSRCWVG